MARLNQKVPKLKQQPEQQTFKANAYRGAGISTKKQKSPYQRMRDRMTDTYSRQRPGYKGFRLGSWGII